VESPTNGPDPDERGDEIEEPEEAVPGAELLAADDIEAFRQLFDAYFDRLYRYVMRYLRSAEASRDLVHDVFLEVWRHRRRIGLERDLRAYLYATARNHALDRLKHSKVEDRFRERQAALASELGEVRAPDVESELESRELSAAIQKAIDTLPRRQREVLQLRWREHLSYEEVGKALDISPKTVAIHLSRAFAHLRQALPGLLD
jgi:RNA polymerase sigma-70 factor (ECF subfamily)